MLLHLNGEQREFPDGLTVAGLVAQLGIKPDRVAVELNLEIVPRSSWEATALKDGDKLEVVHFVGGGSPETKFFPQENRITEKKRTPSWQCPTCGAEVQSKFCPDCGEKKFGASDLSIRHFFTHALEEFFHFDSKIFRAFRLLLTRPGFLSTEYLRGCRKPYLHPFQLFFIANLIYFFLQPFTGWSGLKAWLYVQTHMMFYSGLATRMAAHRMALRGMSETQFNHVFDHAVDIQARSLVILIVPLFALVFWLFHAGKRRSFGEHLVFALHFTAFWLIAIFIGIYGGSTALTRLLIHAGVTFSADHLRIFLMVLSYAVLAAYSFVAMRRFYEDSVTAAALKAILITALFDSIVDVYHLILFLTALYTT